MKNDKHEQNELQRMMEGRAARMIAAAVTVFLCVLTLFEFVALKMEWNVPALAVLSGDNGLWTREYQREELVMDGSTENILLADDGETPLTGSGENAKTNVGENGSGGMVQTGENAGNGEDLQLEGTESVRQEETETPDVSGTGKAEADVKETQTPEFSYYIRNYQGIKELDATIINALIDKILVSEREKLTDGMVRQEIKIYYKFIGFVGELHITPTKRWTALKPKNCTVCGVEYVPRSGISKYCPACAKKIQREKSNESKRRSRERNRQACIELSAKNDRLTWNRGKDVLSVRETIIKRFISSGM